MAIVLSHQICGDLLWGTRTLKPRKQVSSSLSKNAVSGILLRNEQLYDIQVISWGKGIAKHTIFWTIFTLKMSWS